MYFFTQDTPIWLTLGLFIITIGATIYIASLFILEDESEL